MFFKLDKLMSNSINLVSMNFMSINLKLVVTFLVPFGAF